MEVRRAEDCFVTRSDGIVTRHALSFGDHFDPAHTRFGALVAHNEESLAPGAGYGLHRHAGLEIVSWVLEGELTHTDSTGHRAVTRPGTLQQLSTGAGVEHTERNESDRPLRFLQIWLVGDDLDTEPRYAQHEETALRVGRSRLSVVTLGAGHAFRVPEVPYVHLSVARGSLAAGSSGDVRAGDTVRVPGGGGSLTSLEASEILVVEMED